VQDSTKVLTRRAIQRTDVGHRKGHALKECSDQAGRSAAQREGSEAHSPDHFSRIRLGEFLSVNVEAALFDLRKVWLHEATMEVLQEREYAHLERAVRMPLLGGLYCL